MHDIMPSEFIADLRALPLQTPQAGASQLLRRYGPSTPLLLLSLFTDLSRPMLDEPSFQEWLDRAPGPEGKAIANSVRAIAAASNATEDVAAFESTEKAFEALDPLGYALAVLALVRMFSIPPIQALLQRDSDELDRHYEDFCEGTEGQELKAAIQKVKPNPESAV